MFSAIRPYQWVAIRLPNENIRVEQIIPNTHINLGKYGSFYTNRIINRPFYLTWEILDKSEAREGRELRIVKATEIHADTLLEEAESDLTHGSTPAADVDQYGLPATASAKSNVNIFDNPENQKLTMEEIEALKSDEMKNPKEMIAKIMASHSALDQKTAFSLAKYIVRKQKKYMKQFTVLPLDVATMADWMMLERDFSRVMELRNEALGLIGSWANVHAAPKQPPAGEEEGMVQRRCRYLVVDDTGGLVVANIAERMGILHHNPISTQFATTAEDESGDDNDDDNNNNNNEETKPESTATSGTTPRQAKIHAPTPLASSNTITLIHSNQQPNLALLRYFNFDPNIAPSPNAPTPPHPLHSHLKTMSWLQLLDPSSDTTYTEPPYKTPEELHALKSNSRATYHRKRRRWERCKSIIDETRAGGFNALIVATYTNPLSVLHHLIPLLAGGAQIVVYSPHVEPLTTLVDAYSTAHRAAYLQLTEQERMSVVPSPDFPIDPTLTLGFMLQTARARKWQVLPGRTHPLMMARGGAEGYIAVATRVLPVKGAIRARGKQGRFKVKRRNELAENAVLDAVSASEDDDLEESGGENKRAKLDDELLARLASDPLVDMDMEE